MSEFEVPTQIDRIWDTNNAVVTLVEYGDYECPFCAAAHPVVQTLRQTFGSDLRFVFRHFPLAALHPNAESAAETAEFARAHGLFWQMHDALYEQQKWLSVPFLFALTRALELSQIELRYALEIGKYRPKVGNDFLGGERIGVNGTPAFFINNQRYMGPFDIETLSAAIGNHLVQAKGTPSVGIPVRPEKC